MNIETECTASSRRAVDADRATHQRHQMAADGKPEANPADTARNRTVHLSEGGKQLLPALRVNPDAAVGDRNVQDDGLRIGRLQPRADRNTARLGEFDRVVDQTHQDLAQP